MKSEKVVELKSINTSGIQPVDQKVLVKPELLEQVSDGGIVIPKNIRAREEVGHIKAQLIANGSQAFEAVKDPAFRPKPGAMVSIAKYSGYLMMGKDGHEYRVINDSDVVTVLDGDWDIRSKV